MKRIIPTNYWSMVFILIVFFSIITIVFVTFFNLQRIFEGGFICLPLLILILLLPILIYKLKVNEGSILEFIIIFMMIFAFGAIPFFIFMNFKNFPIWIFGITWIILSVFLAKRYYKKHVDEMKNIETCPNCKTKMERLADIYSRRYYRCKKCKYFHYIVPDIKLVKKKSFFGKEKEVFSPRYSNNWKVVKNKKPVILYCPKCKKKGIKQPLYASYGLDLFNECYYECTKCGYDTIPPPPPTNQHTGRNW